MLGRNMKTANSHLNPPIKLSAALLAVLMAVGPLSGCTTIKKGWTGTKDAVTGLFSDDDKEKAAPPAESAQTASDTPAASAPPTTGGLFMGSGSASSAFKSSSGETPSLSSVPSEAPTPPSSAEQRKEAVEGLVADRAKAEYTEQGGRREPVTVRPLNENAATEAAAPPRPQAAPVERVARLEGAPEAPAANSAPPRTTALAERLGAAPPPPPVADSGNAMPTAPAPVPVPAPMAAAPAPTQPLIPSSSSIANYGDDTVLVDGSGVRGGRNVLAAPQLAGVPRAAFDPGNASVSSEVGTIAFTPGSSTLSPRAKTILADIAQLRAQTDGAIRIVGRGDQASARASAISRELRRLGVPAARLYDGGADSTMLGDEADIYLDY